MKSYFRAAKDQTRPDLEVMGAHPLPNFGMVVTPLSPPPPPPQAHRSHHPARPDDLEPEE